LNPNFKILIECNKSILTITSILLYYFYCHYYIFTLLVQSNTSYILNSIVTVTVTTIIISSSSSSSTTTRKTAGGRKNVENLFCFFLSFSRYVHTHKLVFPLCVFSLTHFLYLLAFSNMLVM
jgi:hypothetical protein